MTYLGIIFAVVALLSWGFGDFFIQRTSRKTSVIDALFYITAAAGIGLLPFVWNDLKTLSSSDYGLLLLTGAVAFVVYALEFYVFKIGKLSVVEPVISLELPFTVLIAAVLGHERLGLVSYLLMLAVFIGIALSVSPHHTTISSYFKRLEKGTLLALIAAGGIALANFLIGHSSQSTTPLIAIWAIHLLIALACLVHLLVTRKLKTIFTNFSKAPLLVIAETVFDNAAWIAYAFAVIYIPISVAITLSEGYIILAVVLGVVINREKLKHHQLIGVILAVGGVLLLSALSI